MNALKLLRGVLRHRLLDQPVPIAMTLALTYRCNLRCRYCRIWKAAGEEMSTRQVLACIDELAEAGMCRLGITGGEPLLRDDIDAIVARAKERDLFTTIFTNGALAGQHMRTLRRVDRVLISLDGPRKVHDEMRGRGAFDAATRALEALTAAGIGVWTNTVVTNRNTDVVDYVLETARQHGAQAAFQPVFEHSYSVKGEGVERLQADRRQYTALIDLLLERKRSGAPVLNSIPSLRFLREPVFMPERRRCLASRAYGAVTPEGLLSPCQVLLQQQGLPDGRAIGFVEAFRRAKKPVPCHGCFCFATIEMDLLFSLNPASIVNTLQQLVKDRPRAAGGRREPPPPAEVIPPPGMEDSAPDGRAEDAQEVAAEDLGDVPLRVPSRQ